MSVFATFTHLYFDILNLAWFIIGFFNLEIRFFYKIVLIFYWKAFFKNIIIKLKFP